MILDSKVGNIKSPRFNEEQANCIAEAKKIAPWLTSRQEEALAHLLLEDCASSPKLPEAMRKMLSEMIVYPESDFHNLVDSALIYLRDNCGFADDSTTLFVSFLDGINTDGSMLPARIIRTSQVFRNVFPMHVPVTSEDYVCCRDDITNPSGEHEVKISKIGCSKGPCAFGGPVFSSLAMSLKKHIHNAPKNILVFDDFIGTGDKMIEILNDVKTTFPNASIYLFALIAMEKGYVTISADKNFGNNFIVCTVVKPCNDSTVFCGQHVDAVLDFEKNLTKNKKYTGGYKGSQGLAVISGHPAPNNLFSTLWWDFYPAKPGKSLRPVLFKRGVKNR